MGLRAALPAGARRIEASNGNLPEMPAYHATLVTVGPAWDVTGTSLWTATGDENGEWGLGEERRRVVVDVERRGAWWAAVSRRGVVDAGEARAVAWWAPLVERGGTPETAWMAVIAAAALGTGRRWWMAPVVAIAVVQPWLLAVHTVVAGAIGALIGDRGLGMVRWVVLGAVIAVGVARLWE